MIDPAECVTNHGDFGHGTGVFCRRRRAHWHVYGHSFGFTSLKEARAVVALDNAAWKDITGFELTEDEAIERCTLDHSETWSAVNMRTERESANGPSN